MAETFKVPMDIDFHLPTPSCRLSKPPPGYVVVCLDSSDAGLRLPLCGFYIPMLHVLNVAPLQLNPNVYRVLTTWVVLNNLLGLGAYFG